MPNKNYVKGRCFEYKTKHVLEKNGCVVIRASGSHTAADLVAISPEGNVTFIQCKNKEMSSKAALKLYEETRAALNNPNAGVQVKYKNGLTSGGRT